MKLTELDKAFFAEVRLAVQPKAQQMKAILTKYHGPTDRRGSRISATDMDGNRVVISYDYTLTHDGGHQKAALALCKKMGWTGRLIGGGIKGGNVYVFDPAVPHGAPLTIED